MLPPENAYKVVHFPDNIRRVFKTDHHQATNHHHLPTIIIHIIITKPKTYLHHLSLTVVKDIPNVKTRQSIIAKTIIVRHHHRVIIINNINTMIHAMTIVNRVTIIEATIPGIKYNNEHPPHTYTRPYIEVILDKDKRIFNSYNGKVQVPQWNKCPPHILAVTPYDVTIPPNSQQILPIKQPDCNTNKRLMLRPIYNKNGFGFRVPRTVVWVHQKNTAQYRTT